MRIAVAGGTGVVGRHVVAAAEAAGHEAVVVARSRGVDVVTGDGLAGALTGADAVVDVCNVTTMSERTAVRFFAAVSQRLASAARAAGARHVVTLSIVGVDRVGLGYYRAKLLQEQVAQAGGTPATVLRATQFHEFAEQTLARVPGPLAITPQMRMQPVAAAEVGARLVELAEGEPRGLVEDFGGPEVHELVSLTRKVLAARGSRRLLVPVRLPGPTGRAMATGGLLARGSGPSGSVTFDAWLADQTRNDTPA